MLTGSCSPSGEGGSVRAGRKWTLIQPRLGQVDVVETKDRTTTNVPNKAEIRHRWSRQAGFCAVKHLLILDSIAGFFVLERECPTVLAIQRQQCRVGKTCVFRKQKCMIRKLCAKLCVPRQTAAGGLE